MNEFLEAVEKMRKWQKKFFRGSKDERADALHNSKYWEAQVDDMIRIYHSKEEEQ